MDRKSLIGLVLIGALLVAYSIYTKPSKEQQAENKRINDSIQLVRNQQFEEEKRVRDLQESVTNAEKVVDTENVGDQLERQLGVFAESGQGEDGHIILENDLIRVSIASLGGRVASVELIEYKTHDSLPLILFDEEHSNFNLQFFSQNKSICSKIVFV